MEVYHKICALTFETGRRLVQLLTSMVRQLMMPVHG